jgi:sugar (pentulose or hexulose) kinase
MGVGVFGGWDEIERFVEVAETIEPDAAARERYDALYAAYRELYPALEPVLAAVRRAGAGEPA